MLGNTLQAVYEEAYDDAKRSVWIASRNLNKCDNHDYVKDEYLDIAKENMWKAFNYKAKADLSEGNECNLNMGKALTCLCKAQVYGRMAAK